MSPVGGPPEFEPIVAEYELTPAELAAVDRTLFRRTGAFRVVVGLDVALLLLLAVTRSPALAALLVAELVGLAYLFSVGGRRRWRRHPSARAPRRLLLDAEGVHVSTPDTHATLPWAGVTSVEHIGACHYLFTGPKTALPIPDRALTAEQRQRLGRLASRA